jgi:SPASM domain peptide maturase of grasp-with-spasm system
MFLDSDFFTLFSTCFVTKGLNRSLIVDFNRHRCRLIPNSLCDLFFKSNYVNVTQLINELENDAKDTVKEYFDLLENEEWGIWIPSPENYPMINRHFELPQAINNAIIDVNCSSTYNIERAIIELNQLDCSFLQFRFFDPINANEILAILNHTHNKNFLSVELYIHYLSLSDNYEFLSKKMLFHPKVCRVIVHSSLAEDRGLFGNKELINTKQKISNSSHCGVISPEGFIIEKDFIIEGFDNNNCLNKKIGIDVEGNVKNCPSMIHSFGHIDQIHLKTVILQTAFQAAWRITKSQIDVCRVCEFRDICSDCRAFMEDGEIFSKPKKCTYDPYTMQWL